MSDKVKEAFLKVRQEIDSIRNEMEDIKLSLLSTQSELNMFIGYLREMQEKQERMLLTKAKNEEISSSLIPTNQQITQTNQQIIPTHLETPTHKVPLYALKTLNTQVSTGNGGVPTDRQTNQQTDRHMIYEEKTPKSDFFKAVEILDDLDNIKKEIRRKFKNLTKKEMEVFSVLYSLEEQGSPTDYKTLSEYFKLSESSIRDYMGKIMKKGIPITKEKVDNKQVILHVSQELKKIATLDTILRLRSL